MWYLFIKPGNSILTDFYIQRTPLGQISLKPNKNIKNNQIIPWNKYLCKANSNLTDVKFGVSKTQIRHGNIVQCNGYSNIIFVLVV